MGYIHTLAKILVAFERRCSWYGVECKDARVVGIHGLALASAEDNFRDFCSSQRL